MTLKLYFIKVILPFKVQQIYFSQNLVCWLDTGLLDFFDKNLCIKTPVYGKNWLIEALKQRFTK